MLSNLGGQSEPRRGGGPGFQAGHGFGTAPVFLASISTILGAILFLRFGYAVAHVGLWGSLMVIALGHLVTVPTVLAVSEIATNRRVAGGARTTSSAAPSARVSEALSELPSIFPKPSPLPSISWRSHNLFNLSMIRFIRCLD